MLRKAKQTKRQIIESLNRRVLRERAMSNTPSELPLCSEFKNFLPYNFGWFAPDWDKDGNMILYATKDNEDEGMVNQKDFCRGYA